MCSLLVGCIKTNKIHSNKVNPIKLTFSNLHVNNNMRTNNDAINSLNLKKKA